VTLRPGDRVTLGPNHGRVEHVRSGFARIQWDDGTRTTEWASELTLEEAA
jgi:hypothetical protein